MLLKRNEQKDLLRFSTAGSVDDGKSTLIGRLLYDSKSIFEDQVDAIKKYSVTHREVEIDYSLITDGLKSEREQGITIDVAYRYFSTPKRRFIIADTPGHEQYTRNMATGCSTSSLALVLIDATKGVVTQTKRHTFISSLFGIRHHIVAINKMDLVDFSEEIFNAVADEYRSFSDKLAIESIQFIPISALQGDNIIEWSSRMPWYRGPPLLDYLETVNISSWRNLIDFRFPVQYVNWGGRGSSIRGYCGTIASGIIRPGERVIVLPSGKESRVKKIVTIDGNPIYAYSPQAVTLYLEDDIDISRGDLIVREKNLPFLTRRIESNLVWMDNSPLERGKIYLIKHTTHMVRCEIEEVIHRLDPEDLHRKPSDTLHLNDIGRVTIHLMKQVYADIYEHNRQTGCFIIIDPVTNHTAAAGMITRCHEDILTVEAGTLNQTYWYIGRSVAAEREYESMVHDGIPCIFLDEERLNRGICADLNKGGMTREWMVRAAHFCRLANDSGIPVIITCQYEPSDLIWEIIGEKNLQISR
jgi:sulfate adenylyltransferase large subunit